MNAAVGAVSPTKPSKVAVSTSEPSSVESIVVFMTPTTSRSIESPALSWKVTVAPISGVSPSWSRTITLPGPRSSSEPLSNLVLAPRTE